VIAVLLEVDDLAQSGERPISQRGFWRTVAPGRGVRADLAGSRLGDLRLRIRPEPRHCPTCQKTLRQTAASRARRRIFPGNECFTCFIRPRPALGAPESEQSQRPAPGGLPGAPCIGCRCALAPDEQRCRRCHRRAGTARQHTRAPAAWADDLGALQARAVQSNWPRVDPRAPRALRVSRAAGRVVRRITRVLSFEQRIDVLAALAGHAVRREYLNGGSRCMSCPPDRCRCEWVSEVLLELENPSVLVARREARESISKRTTKAIDRAQAAMRKRRTEFVVGLTE
jgi:hypothetical protein